jgi:SAM-dependent methyltransferase
MFRAQLVLLPGLSKACATHEASAGFGAARLRAMRNPSASAAPDVERVQSVEMDVLSGDGTVAIDEFARARAETIRYHETLYRSTSLGTRGSWLAHPHPLVMDSLGLVTHPVHAYDLGAGVGRHTLPIVAGLPTGSRVTAVDIIPSALASLVENTAAAGLSNCVETVNADLESWAFPADDAGLIVAFSALEHVSSLDAFCAILERCRGATIPGGVNVIGIVADREEVSSSGARRAALIELPLSGEQALSALRRCFTGWQIHVDETIPAAVTEERNGVLHELRSTLIKFVAQAPQ